MKTLLTYRYPKKSLGDKSPSDREDSSNALGVDKWSRVKQFGHAAMCLLKSPASSIHIPLRKRPSVTVSEIGAVAWICVLPRRIFYLFLMLTLGHTWLKTWLS
jgi:hypothetical protein